MGCFHEMVITLINKEIKMFTIETFEELKILILLS